ncbi:MAG: cupredoxin domain-containing protein [Gemmatimonadaceae bacterium]
MRVRLVLPFVVIAFVAACGGSSTGPKPPAHFSTIIVSDTGFAPSALSVQTNTLVTWSVTSGANQHVIRFTSNVPSGGNPNSNVIVNGQSASTTFLQSGTYTYDDSLHAEHHGSIVVQ